MLCAACWHAILCTRRFGQNLTASSHHVSVRTLLEAAFEETAGPVDALGQRRPFNDQDVPQQEETVKVGTIAAR